MVTADDIKKAVGDIQNHYNTNINNNTYFIGPYYIPLLKYFRNIIWLFILIY